MTAQQQWDNFIKRLNEVQKLSKDPKHPLEHKTLFGSVESYRKIFLEANKEFA